MRLVPFFFFLPSVCGLALAVSGCAPHRGSPGSLVVDVLLPDGVPLDALAFHLDGPDIAAIDRTTPLTGPPTSIATTFADLPAGSDYRVTVSATSPDKTIVCKSSVAGDVRPFEITTLVVPLQCSVAQDGHAVVTAAFECRQITLLVAAPTITSVGGQIDLRAETAPQAAGEPVTVAWSSAAGTFTDPMEAATLFTCGTPGPAPITFFAATGRCTDHLTVTVTCVGK